MQESEAIRHAQSKDLTLHEPVKDVWNFTDTVRN